MQTSEGRPAHRQQFGCSVELHRAAAEGNHPVHQGEILADKALDVAQQFGLAAVVVEHGLGQPGEDASRHPLQILS